MFLRFDPAFIMFILVLCVSATYTPKAHAADSSVPKSWRIYVGTYTGGASEGIYLLEMDPESGGLRSGGLAAKTDNPSFLAIHPSQPYLYSVGESGETGTVSAFSIAPSDGHLTLLNQQSSKGSGPCHITLDRTGRYAAVANYGSGSVAVFPVDAQGRLGEASGFNQHQGASINKQRQEGPHAHCVAFDPAGRFLFSADLGLDKVLSYRLDADQGGIAPNTPPFVEVTPGSGPRHIAFHPSGRFMYVINEMGNTISAFHYDSGAGALLPITSAKTLPADYTGESSTAEIAVHPSGRFMYGSNRGDDSLAVYAIDPQSGQLTVRGHVPTQGKTPRNFVIDPRGRFLLVGNQDTNTVVSFRIDPETGMLQSVGTPIDIPMPVCLVFSAMP